MPSYPPKKNVAFTIYLPIVDADGDLVAGAASLTSVLSGDGAAFGAGPVPVDEGEGFYSIALSAAQMGFDAIAGVLKTTTSGAKNTPFTIYTVARQIDDLAFPVVSGRGVDVDAAGGVEVGAFQAGAISAAAFAAGAIDNAAFGVTETLTANPAAGGIVAASFGAGAIDAAAIGTGAIDADAIAAGAITAAKFAAGAIDAAAIAADAIGASELATDAVAEIVNAIFDELTAEVRVAGSYGQLLKDNLNAAVASRSSHTAADVRTEMDANSADLNSIIAFVDELETRLTAARATNLDNLDAAITSRAATGAAMTLTAGERDAVAAALLDLANAVETALTVRGALRLALAALAGKASGLATTTAVYRNAVADSKARITATVDADGNRTAVTADSA